MELEASMIYIVIYDSDNSKLIFDALKCGELANIAHNLIRRAFLVFST